MIAEPTTLLVNHHTAVLPADAPPGPEVQSFHRRLPGYTPTPLRDVPALADAVGVGRVLVKDESHRLGAPSFKAAGASWAVYRALCRRLGGEPAWTRLEDLAAVVSTRLGPLRLVSATDGNHGRAVARVARWLGLDATVLVPDETAVARIAGIESEGADVVVVPGSYEDAVAESAAMADERSMVVSDTSWPGYEDPPRWVVEGYGTIFEELRPQLGTAGRPPVDLAVIPVGVGALAAAAAANLRPGVEPGDGPLLVGVEPAGSACVAAAVEAGRLVEIPGPHRSVLAGLNCGLASLQVLPTLTAAYDAFVGVGDERARAALRSMADAGLEVGETGAAALAGLTALVDHHRVEVPIPDDATVLLVATEGVTDPAAWTEIVGRPPGARGGH